MLAKTTVAIRAMKRFVEREPSAAAFIALIGALVVIGIPAGIINMIEVVQRNGPGAIADMTLQIALTVVAVIAAGIVIIGLVGALGEIGARATPIIAATTATIRRHPPRIVAALLALGFAWFVWPTPYRTFG